MSRIRISIMSLVELIQVAQDVQTFSEDATSQDVLLDRAVRGFCSCLSGEVEIDVPSNALLFLTFAAKGFNDENPETKLEVLGLHEALLKCFDSLEVISLEVISEQDRTS